MRHNILFSLLDRLNTGMILLDPSLKILYWNGWLERYTGKRAENVVGLALTDLYPLFRKKLYQSFFVQTLEQGKNIFCSGALHPIFITPAQGAQECQQNLQIEFLKADGNPYILIQLFDITNQHKRVHLLKQEIAKRIGAEKALRESEEQLRLMTRNLLDVVLETDINGLHTYVSPSHHKILGRGREVLGRSYFEHIHPEERDHISKIFKQAVETKSEERGEYRYFHPGKGYIWLEYIGSTYRNRKNDVVVLFTIRDITQRKQTEEELNYQFQFEKTISEISSTFVNIPSEKINEVVKYALQLIGAFFQVDRSYIFQYSSDGTKMSSTHEWCADGIKPQMERSKNLSVDTFPWFDRSIKTKKYVYIPDINDLPPEAAAEKEEFYFQGTRSFLCIPMVRNGDLVGFLGFDVVKEKKEWAEDTIMLLKVVVELISNAFTRHQIEEKIRHLSFHDSLTGLYNRVYLEEEMNRLSTERQLPISIIMADLNGLKLINDMYGHSTGDELLRCAANVFKKSCRQEDIIARWGGDEFVILLVKTTKSEAWAICERINDICSKTFVEDIPISIALGVVSKDTLDKNLEQILKEAEDEMYKNKLTESRSMKSAVLNTLLKTLEEKCCETQAHTRRMQDIALKIGDKINLSNSEQSRLGLLIRLHDIGKINIPEEILNKKGDLTAEEWEVMKKHSETGYRIARATEDFSHVAEEILFHHEHWDGRGYPNGLKGEEIPLLARIASVVDAYEVMINGRPYKIQLSKSQAAAELKRCAGTQFDPELVEVFLRILAV